MKNGSLTVKPCQGVFFFPLSLICYHIQFLFEISHHLFLVPTDQQCHPYMLQVLRTQCSQHRWVLT